jgi:hypothetical protein
MYLIFPRHVDDYLYFIEYAAENFIREYPTHSVGEIAMYIHEDFGL